MNLHWGIKPLVVEGIPTSFEGLVHLAEATLRERELVISGDKILVVGGVPPGMPRGSNFIKLHLKVQYRARLNGGGRQDQGVSQAVAACFGGAARGDDESRENANEHIHDDIARIAAYCLMNSPSASTTNSSEVIGGGNLGPTPKSERFRLAVS